MTQLVHSFQEPEYAWNKRHTAQSWLEHYKNNRDRLDVLVAEIVAKAPADPKFLYPLSRQHTKRRQGFIGVRDEEIREDADDELFADIQQVESLVQGVPSATEEPDSESPAAPAQASPPNEELREENEEDEEVAEEVPVGGEHFEEQEEESGGYSMPPNWEYAGFPSFSQLNSDIRTGRLPPHSNPLSWKMAKAIRSWTKRGTTVFYRLHSRSPMRLSQRRRRL